MNNILIFSQDEKYTCFCRSIAIGARRDTKLIGDKLKELLKNNKITKEEFIKKIGNNYKDTINRILDDKEIPNEKMLNKIINYFKLKNDYFTDKELENVIITDNGIIIGEYKTNEEAIKIKNELDNIIEQNYLNNKPILIKMPK